MNPESRLDHVVLSPSTAVPSAAGWPELPLAEWRSTYQTLHLWTQIVGKVRLTLTPRMNQWWNVPLYLTTSGLTTSPMPYGDDTVQIDFDFQKHELLVKKCGGEERVISLGPFSVKVFYHELMDALAALGVEVAIRPVPTEIPFHTRYDEDTEHASYDAEQVDRFWQALRRVGPIFEAFRARYRGKCSPVHFFWGSFDLAVSRFSGRPAPERSGSIIEREAYDEEVESLGFWLGDAWGAFGGDKEALFYAYAVPEPAGFSGARVLPDSAFYSTEMKEFILPYEEARTSPDPARTILDFAQSTYEAAATRAKWERSRLEYV